MSFSGSMPSVIVMLYSLGLTFITIYFAPRFKPRIAFATFEVYFISADTKCYKLASFSCHLIPDEKKIHSQTRGIEF